MTSSDDPFALLPFAIAGIVVGLGMALACGYVGYQQWAARADRMDRHATLEGRIEWAGWRQSAVGGGPDRYLQLRISGDDRGFLVAATSLPVSYRERLGAAEGEQRQIASLVGKSATLVVDSSLKTSPGTPTPYLSALRVEGETVVPLDGDGSASSPLWKGVALGLLLGLGVFTGGGLLIGSLQHVVVCIRYGRS